MSTKLHLILNGETLVRVVVPKRNGCSRRRKNCRSWSCKRMGRRNRTSIAQYYSVVRFPVGRNRERCILWPDVGTVGGNNTNCWKVNEEQVKENVAVRESEVRKSEMEMEMEIGICTAVAAAAALSV